MEGYLLFKEGKSENARLFESELRASSTQIRLNNYYETIAHHVDELLAVFGDNSKKEFLKTTSSLLKDVKDEFGNAVGPGYRSHYILKKVKVVKDVGVTMATTCCSISLDDLRVTAC